MINHEIRVTGDGSKTIFLPELNETYHSSNGAVQESRHIFIQNGLDLVEKKERFVYSRLVSAQD
jgi:hypothetical protein